MKRPLRILKTIRTLGAEQLWNYTLYQMQLKSGWLSRSSHSVLSGASGSFQPLRFPSREEMLPFLEAAAARIRAAASGISRNRFAPFFRETETTLDFRPRNPHTHWTKLRPAAQEDIKLIWEPARFCWAVDLARAWLLSGNPSYKNIFFEQVRRFTRENPAGCGENWLSAQEAAIRIILFSFCGSLFLNGTDPEEPERRFLAEVIRTHAERIPPTLSYARAQNNNHWLSEAAGLMTAACVLPDAAQAEKWFATGWKEFRRALGKQIAPDGAYIQASTNYHRMMLQLVLWVDFLLRMKRLSWPPALHGKIRHATNWLVRWTDCSSGQACNLGHNDGTLLFATGGEYADYRPTLQALSRRFCGQPLYPSGPWDELGRWFGVQTAESPREMQSPQPDSIFNDTVLHVGERSDWGLIQTLGYKGRPAHDDQLNVHLWHSGQPAALDAGTYQYNALPPWNNGLKTAFVHNLLLVDRMEPMTDAGKFLWLDWDRARVLERNDHSAVAEHTAFEKIGLKHVRRLEKTTEGWQIVDQVTPLTPPDPLIHHYRLHWLLADQPFEMMPGNGELGLSTAVFALRFVCASVPLEIQLIRAGETVFASGNMAEPEEIQAISGWFSPTYAEKKPALSVIVTASGLAPFTIRSEWRFF